jgi:N-glycosylase/DNA lyase
MKQVAHIRQISRTLRTRYGERRRIRDCEVHSFPTACRIAKLTEQNLRACALGYRAKNLLATARLVASGDADIEEWSELSDESLRVRLCELPGVGAKVANCVMLFAYERLRAFPIDVWIERVLKQKYFPRKRKVTAAQLRAFCETYFGEHGGYAQQYLFHHARKGGAASRVAAKRKPGGAGC